MSEERKAGHGDTVRVHYTGTLSDGSVFDSSANREPLSFTIGGEQVLSPFESAAVGMQVGDVKTIEIEAADGYGERDEDLVIPFDRSAFPEGVSPEVGQPLQLSHQDGSTIEVVVIAVSDEEVMLDANHPLAGQDLTFSIELVEIEAT